MKKGRFIAALAALPALAACAGVDLPREEAALRQVLERERAAHFQRDAALFVGGFVDSMVSVNRGSVTRLPAEAYRQRFQSYFDGAEFLAWDDREPPRITFSDDGNLAYVVVQKTVTLMADPEPVTTEFAWVSIYRKQDGAWKLECNVSTNR